MTTAEIITIGTELLLGETVDTNTRHIAQILRRMGVDLYRTQTIGDNSERIAGLMREALGRADFIITTGGLGPTVDDPTRSAAALASGCFLEYHSELWEQIKNRISLYGRTPTENQKRQAYLPQFAIAIENPVGTAPAFIVETGQKSMICLPGVPREMETLLRNAVVPYLREHFKLDEEIQIRTLHVSGIGEGILDDKIGDLETLSNPTVGLTAHSGIVSIRVAAKGRNSTETGFLIGKIENELMQRLGIDIYGADDETLELKTLQLVERRGWNLATVEFNTDNLLHNRLTRTKHPAYIGGKMIPAMEMELASTLEIVMKELNTSAGLGIFCNFQNSEKQALVVLFTPIKKVEQEYKYGGHPENLPRWAVNMGLDQLRRMILRDVGNAK